MPGERVGAVIMLGIGVGAAETADSACDGDPAAQPAKASVDINSKPSHRKCRLIFTTVV
jgi:hypothetical protein